MVYHVKNHVRVLCKIVVKLIYTQVAHLNSLDVVGASRASAEPILRDTVRLWSDDARGAISSCGLEEITGRQNLEDSPRIDKLNKQQ